MPYKKRLILAYFSVGLIIFLFFGLKDGASGLLGSIIGFLYFFPGIYVGILVSGFYLEFVGGGESMTGNIILFLTSVAVNCFIIARIPTQNSRK